MDVIVDCIKVQANSDAYNKICRMIDKGVAEPLHEAIKEHKAYPQTNSLWISCEIISKFCLENFRWQDTGS